MLTLYRIQTAFASAQKPLCIELLFAHKNGDFGAISARSEATPRQSRKWLVTSRIGSVPHFGTV